MKILDAKAAVDKEWKKLEATRAWQLEKSPQRGMMRKLKVTSGLLQENSFIVITLNPRVKLYMPKERSFPIPINYIDVTRTTLSSPDVLLEKNIEDHWNEDGEKEMSDAWTGFTRFILLNERPPDGYAWSGERLARKPTTSRPDDVWPGMWKHMSDAAKTKMGCRETKARQCQTFERNSSLNQTTKNSSSQ